MTILAKHGIITAGGDFMLKKFKALSTLKKTTIILVLIAAFLVLAPLTVKYASAGEIDLFAMVQELFARADSRTPGFWS